MTRSPEVNATGASQGGALGALALVGVIVLVEYGARHLLAPALPVLATPHVDDMAVTGAAYVALSLVVARAVGARAANGVLSAVAQAAGAWQAWVGGILALVSALLFGLVDHFAWGGVTLPSFSLPASTTTLAANARWLEPASMLLVNGLVVPVAEEWLWRGVVQPRFVSRMGLGAGIAVTAILFSAKHAVVDASLGRALAITCGGAVLGWVAHKATWRASALSHVMMNTVATFGVIVYGLVQRSEACPVPQPALSPELQQATDRLVALIDTRDVAEVRSLFTPAFLAAVTEPKTLSVLESVHAKQGKCRLRCIVSLDGPYKATELLACERGTEWMQLELESAPPHRIDAALTRPAVVP
jgi:membrane protease YdiL (CAAX protease family)